MSTNSLLQQLRNKLQLVLKEYGSTRKQLTVLQNEMGRLSQMISEKEAEIERLNEKMAAQSLNRLTHDPDTKKELEKRINTYLKEIDKCLALLKT